VVCDGGFGTARRAGRGFFDDLCDRFAIGGWGIGGARSGGLRRTCDPRLISFNRYAMWGVYPGCAADSDPSLCCGAPVGGLVGRISNPSYSRVGAKLGRAGRRGWRSLRRSRERGGVEDGLLVVGTEYGSTEYGFVGTEASKVGARRSGL
jgi:hypothetical protein